MSMLIVGIPKEVHAEERRVAATPSSVVKLMELGFEVRVEKGAGVLSNYPDAGYQEAGA